MLQYMVATYSDIICVKIYLFVNNDRTHFVLFYTLFFTCEFHVIVRDTRDNPLLVFDALDWFRSYLTGRIQRVVIENAVSGDQELGFGVPQGSVLGPKIYCMYTKPVSDIIQ